MNMKHEHTNGHHVIEYDQKCESCQGAGIYVGLAEREGAAVVCRTCEGTGCHHTKIEYDDFTGRVMREGVKRVYEVNPGICIGEGNGHKLSDFGGENYEDWLADGSLAVGTENRRYTCPCWWYQSADYTKKPKWKECLGCGIFSRCEHFKHKDECWARWDAEYASK